MDLYDQRETFTYEDAWQQERLLTFIEAMGEDNTPFLAGQEKKALEAGVPIIRTQTQSLIKFLLKLKKPARILEIGTGTGFSALFMLTYAPAVLGTASVQLDTLQENPAQETITREGNVPENSGELNIKQMDSVSAASTKEIFAQRKLDQEDLAITISLAKGSTFENNISESSTSKNSISEDSTLDLFATTPASGTDIFPHPPVILTIEKDETRYQAALANVQKAVEASALDDPRRIDLRLGDAADILPQLTGTFDFIFMDAAKGQYIHFLPEVLRLLSEDGILLSDNIFKDGEILESRYAVKRRDRTIHKRMREYIYALTHHPQLQTLLLEEGDGAAVSLRTRTPG